MPALVSTRTGLLKPNSAMLAAICATCSSECVRAFRAYGTSRSNGQNSIRLAIAGVMRDSTTDAVHDLNPPPDPPHHGHRHRIANRPVSRAIRGGLSAIGDKRIIVRKSYQSLVFSRCGVPDAIADNKIDLFFSERARPSPGDTRQYPVNPRDLFDARRRIPRQALRAQEVPPRHVASLQDVRQRRRDGGAGALERRTERPGLARRNHTRVLPASGGWLQSPVRRSTTGRRGRFPRRPSEAAVCQQGSKTRWPGCHAGHPGRLVCRRRRRTGRAFRRQERRLPLRPARCA